jgi:hypothetical protein
MTYLGSIRYLDAEGPAGETLTVQVTPGDPVPSPGEAVVICWRPEACFLIKE